MLHATYPAAAELVRVGLHIFGWHVCQGEICFIFELILRFCSRCQSVLQGAC